MEIHSFSSTNCTYPQKVLFLKPTEDEKKDKKEIKKLKPKSKKKVVWAEDTIDNENMNKLKSKSIPIFKLSFFFIKLNL